MMYKEETAMTKKEKTVKKTTVFIQSPMGGEITGRDPCKGGQCR